MVGLHSIGANPLGSQQPGLPKPNHQPAIIDDNDERLPIGPDGSLFLAGAECGPDEQLAPGMLPTCEPICPKMFFSGIDYVPCFCRPPLVRNQQTRQCVPLSECPPVTKPIKPQQI